MVHATLTSAPACRFLLVGPQSDRGHPQIGNDCRTPPCAGCKQETPTRGRDTRESPGSRGRWSPESRLPGEDTAAPSPQSSSDGSHSGRGRMARAARDRGVDAAQTRTAEAMASRAPASSQPSRRAASPLPPRPRPAPPSPRPAPPPPGQWDFPRCSREPRPPQTSTGGLPMTR